MLLSSWPGETITHTLTGTLSYPSPRMRYFCGTSTPFYTLTPSHRTKLSLYFWGWEAARFQYPNFYQEKNTLGGSFIHLQVFIVHLLRPGTALGSEGAVVLKTKCSPAQFQTNGRQTIKNKHVQTVI